MKTKKYCKCDDYESCTSETSCLYDFISVSDVSDLGTITIEDVQYNDKIVICTEHVPELINKLESKCDNSECAMNQWLVTYDDGYELTKCLFDNWVSAENYRHYIDDIFISEGIKATMHEVSVNYK